LKSERKESSILSRILRKGKGFILLVMLILIIFLPLIQVGTAALTYQYYPSAYKLLGSTQYVSGSLANLTANDGVFMTFQSYLNYSGGPLGRSLYAHNESITVASTSYYLLKLITADTSGLGLPALVGAVGDVLFGKFLYSFQGVSSIPASTWTVYYRAKAGGGTVYGVIDILIRKSDGAVRTTIGSKVAQPSSSFGTSYATYSGTYSFAAYTVVAQTDYLEIDYYAHVTVKGTGKSAYLDIDDNSLSPSDQTRVTNVYLPGQQIAEVEFSGIASTSTWTQLNVTVDSRWNVSSVGVTIQLYNFTANAYPTSGSAYLSYTSSATPNTDETKQLTVTSGAPSFHNSTGGWKLKIHGDKSVIQAFLMKIDYIQLSIMPLHDVAVTSVTTSRPYASQGQIIGINVVVYNKGGEYENVTVTTYYNTTVIGTQTVQNLGGLSSYTLNFPWDTTSVTPGNYVIKAVATPVPGETNTADNTFAMPYLYYPSSYNLLGSTTYASGGISNLTTNDGVYMTFKSYYNATQGANIADVEFPSTAGLGFIWSKLNVTVDSAWNVSSVGVTIQLYNYTAKAYPNSESGYLSYTSSGTPNTDETKKLTVTNGAPTFFNSTTQAWKLRIKGAKSGAAGLLMKVDYIQLSIIGYVKIYKKPSVSVIPANVTGPPPNINQYFSVNITVTNAHDLYAWQAGMTFNASVLQAANMTEGPFLKNWATVNGQTTLFLSGTINNSTGVITYYGCTLTGAIPGASGNGTLAKVFFKVKASGTSNLVLTSVILTDSLLTAMPATLNNGFFKLPPSGPPIASFTFSPPNPVVGQTVTFDASASSGGGGTITNYKWTFGDGNTTSSGTNPIIYHVYSSANSYTVVLNVTNSLGLWSTTSKVVPVTTGYALNLRVMDFDNATAISGAYVYKGSDVKTSNVNGWANWTGVSGTVSIKVKYYGAWVYGVSLTVSSPTTKIMKCNIFDIQITTIEGTSGTPPHNVWLQYANVTVFNATSTQTNKITTGITGVSGVVSLLNVPNSTLTFTIYDGATPTKHVIANVTRTITAENQAETITCTSYAVSATLNGAIVEGRVKSAGIILPFILISGLIFSSSSSFNGLKERIKTIRSKTDLNENKNKKRRKEKT